MLRKSQKRIDAVLATRLRDMSVGQLREIIVVLSPILLLAALALWVATRFVEPAPPSRIAISTASETGNYFSSGKRYAAILARSGVTLDVKTSAGSVQNVERLKDPGSGIDVALLQGGTTNSHESPDLVSLGRIYLEPLWVFVRADARISRLSDMQGKRLVVGAQGSGTQALVMKLLAVNEITGQTAALMPLSGKPAIDAVISGQADAAFFVSGASSEQVQVLSRAEGIKLLSLPHAEAYVRNFPFLSRVTLPKGTINIARNIPETDLEMVASQAVLVARNTLHPALVGLLTEAAKEVHSAGGLFNRTNEFPIMSDPEFPVHGEAERTFKAGPSFLKRNMPFWLASLIERSMLIAVPLLGVLLPLAKLGPWFYRWRVKRRLNYWYGRLNAVETSLAAGDAGLDYNACLEEVGRIEQAVTAVPVPVTFADQYYTLRAAIDLVRQRLKNQAVVSTALLS